MSTAPTERRLAITPGEAHIMDQHEAGTHLKGFKVIVVDGSSTAYVDANHAPLYCDAHNTFNTCGLKPSELLAKVREQEKERIVEECRRMDAMLVTDDDLGPRRELAETDDFADPMNGGFSDESDPTLNLPQ